MAVLTRVQCQRCGYIWIPRTSSPAVCPRCKQYNWQRMATTHRRKKKSGW